jgi:hypothetical protein
MANQPEKNEAELEDAVDAYWKEVQEGLDDDLRDDSETFDLVTDSYRAGWLAAPRPDQKKVWILKTDPVDGHNLGIRIFSSRQKALDEMIELIEYAGGVGSIDSVHDEIESDGEVHWNSDGDEVSISLVMMVTED